MVGVLQRPEELIDMPLRLMRDTNTKLARGVEMENAGGPRYHTSLILQRVRVGEVKLVT